jgi:hypothetical protein
MNKYAYPGDDEIMAECRQRKAELRERYVDDEGYNKHLDEMRPIMEAEGWHFETPEERAARFARIEANPSAHIFCLPRSVRERLGVE